MSQQYYVKVIDGRVVEAVSYTGVDMPAPEGFQAVDAEVWDQAQAGATQQRDGTFTAQVRRREITPSEFLNRLTETEEVAIELLANQTGSAEALRIAAGIRVWLRRLITAPTVPLDSPEVTTQLARLKPLLIAAGVWSVETADARIAELLI